eukprot:Plantae.Rhodophyta-Palmaria_palmata.ctg5175.p1 GENE.Plantae.Rhodophyta-Palmaria_palmata.ctg5175~~Plantae.Rhodophyta-Palmaria_palmata.ctg5175.p1  ORF type:complete len:258 (+),score=24.54 Plantae.Rhodophyta-Palmaria_palmata.ctg5175:111-776(+)
MPKLFYKITYGNLKAVLIKLVDDLLIGASKSEKDMLIKQLGNKFKIRTLTHTPGSLLCYGAKVEQKYDGTIEISADDKLKTIFPNQVGRERRRQLESVVTSDELSEFRSMNGKISWLVMLISPTESFLSSHLQQRFHFATVADLLKQIKAANILQKMGTKLLFGRPDAGSTQNISVLTITDAARPNERAQLGIISGLVISEVKAGSLFHPLGWAPFCMAHL